MTQPDFWSIASFSQHGWGWALSQAALSTILISIFGFLLGAAIGTVGAWAKISGGLVARVIADFYTTVLRGIPDLLVIYLIYFGGSAAVGAIGHWFGADGFIGLPGFLAGVCALGVTSGAQHTEVFRGAYNAVHRGEIEAALACGMSRTLCFRRIIAPLTLRYALPGLGNVWQVVLKESALVSVTGVVEIMRQAQIGAGSTGLPFYFFALGALAYLAISTVSGSLLQWLERWQSRGLRRP